MSGGVVRPTDEWIGADRHRDENSFKKLRTLAGRATTCVQSLLVLGSEVFAHPSDHHGDIGFDRFGCPNEQVGQIGGKVRQVDLRRAPVEGNWLGLCVHSGNFEEGGPAGSGDTRAVSLGRLNLDDTMTPVCQPGVSGVVDRP
jgi:hypothetical protein